MSCIPSTDADVLNAADIIATVSKPVVMMMPGRLAKWAESIPALKLG
ncbi:hypothetical protein [Prosthecobacter sp.]